MALILHIETATDVCSVCLAKEGVLLGVQEIQEKNSHAGKLHILIMKLLENHQCRFADIDAFAVSQGPGSYTGLRIGVSAAKGFCFSLDKPLIAVNTLLSMTAFYLMKTNNTNFSVDLFCPMIDARRMEVYNAMFAYNLETVLKTNAVILEENSYAEVLRTQKVHFFGDGSQKFQKILKNNGNAQFEENFSTSSAGMIRLAFDAYLAGNFVDLAHFEPFYLKDFVTSGSGK